MHIENLFKIFKKLSFAWPIHLKEDTPLSEPMHKRYVVLACCLLFLIAPLLGVHAFETSSLQQTFINDQADIIDPASEQRITQFLQALEQNTTLEFAVVTVQSLDGDTIFDASLEAARHLGVGKEDVDNGLLLFIALEDRQYFVQVGYGLEGAIPDVVAARVADEHLVPAFREGRYAEGIEATLVDYAALAMGDPQAQSKYQSAYQNEEAVASWIQIAIFIIIMLLIIGGKVGIWPIFFMGGMRGGSMGGGAFGSGGFGGFGGGGFGGGGAGGGW
jgi:uncharacterized protein